MLDETRPRLVLSAGLGVMLRAGIRPLVKVGSRTRDGEYQVVVLDALWQFYKACAALKWEKILKKLD